MAELLRATDLAVRFPLRPGFLEGLAGRQGGAVRAVDGVSLSLAEGEILALVGESGCGKTTTGKALLRLADERRVSGRVSFGGEDLYAMRPAALRSFRSRAQMIYQDPYQSLNPKDSVFDAVAEGPRIHRRFGAGELGELVERALEDSGLRPASDYMRRYPHELSGGQRQRVAIASAIVLSPRFVVADEPVSMLDVSVRAGIVRLLESLRESRGLAYVFITHDLSLAWLIADRVAVMYLGKIVEEGPAAQVIARPAHPYARALVEVAPRLESRAARSRGGRRAAVSGEPPDPARIPPGCRFHPRCPRAQERCAIEEPELRPLGSAQAVAGHAVTGHAVAGHAVACHLAEELAP